MPSRSEELMLTGYYLSRFGIVDPPQRLKTNWKQVYFMFYDSLNSGRTVLEFEHSLKNARDTFDGYFENGRVGWLNSDKSGPLELTGNNLIIYENNQDLEEIEVWEKIAKYSNLEESLEVRNQLISEDNLNSDSSVYTEGKQKVYISKKRERNAKLRKKAIEIHGSSCMVCDFNFGEKYGSLGDGFIEVHHVKPISEYRKEKPTNPELDLVVLCANCHRMVHRKKDYVLSVDELMRVVQKAGYQS